SLPDPASASPHDVARFFAGLDDAGRRAPVRPHPLVVGWGSVFGPIDAAVRPGRGEAGPIGEAQGEGAHTRAHQLLGHAEGKQALLEGQGQGGLAGVAACVVDAEG
ncbi:hypothetical protein ADK52_11830, partial [Streptomyces sp. WM6372]